MRRLKTKILQLAAGLSCSILLATSAQANLAQSPLFLTQAIAPLVMLNMSNDNQLFFQAYPEYADLTGDGNIEFTYTHSFEYYGYFDPNQCYSYDTANNRYSPEGETSDGYCDNVSGGDWSGNFLNWVSMARIDVVRKILYGGYRSTDDTDLTVLERTYLPNDAHSWVRYYNGDDLSKLTPYGTSTDRVRTADDGPLEFSSSTSFEIPSGSRNDSDDRQTLTLSGWNNQGDIQIGDQIRILSTPTTAANAATLEAVVYGRSYNNNQISVQITNVTPSSRVEDTFSNWRIENLSRVGVSFCNTTSSNTTESHDVADPPLIRAARGDYSLWTANERWQCQWSDEENRTGTNSMQVGGVNFSNGNYMTASGLRGNSDNPVRSEVGLGQQNYVARVEVCNESPVNGDACTEYPNGEFKPTGLLQEYGASGDIDFGLLTGTYDKNLSGGTLRKNIKTFSDEVDEDTGQFIQPDDDDGSIVGSMNALRIYGYNHDTGVYEDAGDDCGVGVEKSEMQDGKCMNWGNPQAEMFLEAVRYFAGADPTSAFEVTDDRISGLTSEEWEDPLSNDNWCANLNLVNFNASYSSFDGEELDGISDLNTEEDVDYWTNRVGEGEGLHADDTEAFFGGGNALCTAKDLGFLADVTGLCPEAPNQDGTYHIAGLAHLAWSESIRDDLRDASENTADVHVRTHGVALAAAIPRIEIPKPGESEPAVTILPACENQGDGGLRCALTDFRVIDLDLENGTGSFFIQWDVHEWGSDFDMDINGTLSYEITDDEITVTTRTWADSSGRSTGFGYVTSGTEKDGYHAHSGINGYTYTDPTGATDCSGTGGCSVNEPPTSYTYTLSGDGPAQLLREPLYYAAKWGGYDKSRDFPSDVSSWDRNGDGLPDNYYFAIDPARLAENLSQVFRDIVETSDSATAVATNSSRLDTDTKVFQAQFDSGGWFGDLLAFDFIDQELMWSAATELRNMNNPSVNRTILTSIDDDPEFLGETIPAAMNADGLGQDRIDWLFGESVSGLRDRTFNLQREILGDIVNSNPQFVGRANYGNRLIGGTEGTSYSTFRASEDYRDRPDMVYVGANDGMLHGFSVDSGEEWFGYVPSELLTETMDGEDYAPLAYLSDPDYEHRYFVDGTPIIRDAYIEDEFGDRSWKSVLVGTMGNGGRTVFALDVTKPQDNFDTDNVLWEFTHDELGYGVTNPEIVRLPSGEWAAVFGNGYGSDSGRSGIFIVNLSDPEDYDFISSGNGNPANQNAMAPVMVTDWGNNNRVASRGYAGDLQGRLYRIDFDDDDLDEATLTQIFRTDSNQPITVKPVGQPHPRQNNAYVVSFGTGSYFRNQDRLDNNVQALYGIIDDGSVVDFDDLLQQRIIFQEDREFTFDGEDVTFALRATTDHQLDENNPEPGWYLRLEYDETNQGERVVSRPSLAPGAGRNAVRFTTLIPDIDPCGIGRTGYLMELDILSGSRPDAPVFDLDGDGVFDDEDMITIIVDGEEITVPVSGVGGVTQGEELSTVQDIQGVEQIVQPVDPDDDDPDPSPGLLGDQGTSGRIGWEQLR